MDKNAKIFAICNFCRILAKIIFARLNKNNDFLNDFCKIAKMLQKLNDLFLQQKCKNFAEILCKLLAKCKCFIYDVCNNFCKLQKIFAKNTIQFSPNCKIAKIIFTKLQTLKTPIFHHFFSIFANLFSSFPAVTMINCTLTTT